MPFFGKKSRSCICTIVFLPTFVAEKGEVLCYRASNKTTKVPQLCRLGRIGNLVKIGNCRATVIVAKSSHQLKKERIEKIHCLVSFTAFVYAGGWEGEMRMAKVRIPALCWKMAILRDKGIMSKTVVLNFVFFSPFAKN